MTQTRTDFHESASKLSFETRLFIDGKFGGYKESGFGGKDKSLMAHDQYTETKTIWIQLR
jgi:acyl-CoA reductase-like NAD-dependent aldehyde dehydrogenase